MKTMTAADPESIAHAIATDLDTGFTDMVLAYQPGIYSGALRLTRHPHDAQDVAQDTFLRAYSALERYDEQRIRTLRIRPWLWTIALNLCRNRATRTKPTVPMATHLDTGTTDPETLDIDLWNQRLGALSDPQRAAVVLRHVADLPIADITDITGRPEGTVKADISRGLAKLRTVVAEEDIHAH